MNEWNKVGRRFEIKKLLFLLVLIMGAVLLSGCISGAAYGGEASVALENGEYVIVLPLLERKFVVRDSYIKYVTHIDAELLIKAEKELFKDMGSYKDSAPIYLSQDSEGYLCLACEYIVAIDPPKIEVLEDGTVISDGCGIDHEHLFWDERITKERFDRN